MNDVFSIIIKSLESRGHTRASCLTSTRTEEPQITSISVANLRESVPLIFPLPFQASLYPTWPTKRRKRHGRAVCRPHNATRLAEPRRWIAMERDPARKQNHAVAATGQYRYDRWFLPDRPRFQHALFAVGEQICEERERKKRLVQTFRESVTRIFCLSKRFVKRK